MYIVLAKSYLVNLEQIEYIVGVPKGYPYPRVRIHGPQFPITLEISGSLVHISRDTTCNTGLDVTSKCLHSGQAAGI